MTGTEVGNWIIVLNTLLIGVVGYFLRDFMERSRRTHSLTIKNMTEIELLKSTYQKDIQTLNSNLEKLADSFEKMDERLREKDNELIKELKELVRQGKNNGRV